MNLHHTLRISQGIAYYSFLLYLIYASLSNISNFFFVSNVMLIILSLITVKMFIFSFIGFYQVQQWEKKDWKEMYDNDERAGKLEWDDVHHFVIIPNYKESYEILSNTLEHLSKFKMAARQIGILLAMEAREEGHVEKAQKLIEQYSASFREVLFCSHPSGVPGELPGKASNENFAAHYLISHLEEKCDDLKKCVVSVTDADSHFHIDYFDCLTYKFCTDSHRYNKTYQSPIFGIKNYYDVPAFLRIIACNFTIHELACLVDPFDHHIPFSTYSMPLLTIKNVGGWDPDNITEDWHMYLKTYFHGNGDHCVEPILLPTTNYILESDGWWETMKARFIQSQRHMWSFCEVAFLFTNSLTNRHAWTQNFARTLNLHIKVLYIHYLPIIPIPVMFLGGILTFWYSMINFDPAIYALSWWTRNLQLFAFGLTSITVLLNNYIVAYVLRGKEKNYGFRSNMFYNMFEHIILNSAAAFFLIFIPSIMSLTQLMFSDNLNYVVAAKPTTKEES